MVLFRLGKYSSVGVFDGDNRGSWAAAECERSVSYISARQRGSRWKALA
jgi:hypothetical protein